MPVGYNLVEENLIGREVEEIGEKMSVIEFLRRLNKGELIRKTIGIVGLELVLEGEEDVARYVRSVLVKVSEKMRNHVIQFIIDGELVLNLEPKIKLRNVTLRLTPIFGNRLAYKSVGWFHAPFNI